MSARVVFKKTAKSRDLLELAERYAKQAEGMPVGDDKRKWLEEEAARLVDEARGLTEQAKKAADKYR